MRRPLLLLTSSIAIVGSNSLVLSPISTSVAQSFAGTDAADVMTASAIYGVFTALSAVLLAPKADQIGLARALKWAFVLFSIALLTSAAAPTFIWLCIGQALAGLAAGIALPATYGLTAEISPKGKESETLGKVLTGWTLSMVAGVSLSALLADLVHWRGVFLVMGGAAILISIVLVSAGNWAGRPNITATSSPFTALKVQGIYPALMVCAAYMVAFYGLYAYLGTHLQGPLGLNGTVASLAPFAYGVGFGLAAFFGRSIDTYGSDRLAPVIFAALLGVYLLFAGSSLLAPLVIVLCLLWGLVNHLGLNLIVGRLTALDETQRGAIMGLYSGITYLAMFLGTALFRPVFIQYGFLACSLLAAICILPALADGFQLRRKSNRDPLPVSSNSFERNSP
ncbi:MAG: MFS transporter [Proteobacteria bacterium]|nr:MFS transporter [Pseudomonadota bacterium]